MIKYDTVVVPVRYNIPHFKIRLPEIRIHRPFELPAVDPAKFANLQARYNVALKQVDALKLKIKDMLGNLAKLKK